MASYLVVIDDSAESALAMRFAARRAIPGGAIVHVLAIVPPQEFVAWGGAQATIEAEAKARAESLVAGAAGALIEESGIAPRITVRQGEEIDVVKTVLEENDDFTALVLGAAAEGAPGPLVTHFAANAAQLPCPLVIIPGGLTPEELDRVS